MRCRELVSHDRNDRYDRKNYMETRLKPAFVETNLELGNLGARFLHYFTVLSFVALQLLIIIIIIIIIMIIIIIIIIITIF